MRLGWNVLPLVLLGVCWQQHCMADSPPDLPWLPVGAVNMTGYLLLPTPCLLLHVAMCLVEVAWCSVVLGWYGVVSVVSVMSVVRVSVVSVLRVWCL